MKKGRIFSGMLGMLAVTLILGMTIVGCGGGGGGGTPPNGSGGTFTLTVIPSQYNGKYAFLWVDDFWEGESGFYIYGCQGNINNQTIMGVRISDGKVNIPMIIERNNTYELYSGNHAVNLVRVGLYDSAPIQDEGQDDLVGIIDFSSVTFSNGSAARSWSSGNWQTAY